MTRWAMVADLERCVGCQTCTAACRHANATSPAVQWRKVLDIESGVYPEVSRTFVPVGCQHCADPPCMDVCPSTATRQRQDGIVTIDYDLCIGCAYCAVACPYQARFKIQAPRFAYGVSQLASELAREDPRRIGVAQKCTFCVDRVDAGIALGLAPGVDPSATPACVNSCIAGALHFGDLDDPGSNVATLLREHRHFRMHEALGTDPGFYYLHGKANGAARTAATADGHGGAADDSLPFKRGGMGRGSEPEIYPLPVASRPTSPFQGEVRRSGEGSIRAKGVEPWLQSHWDWRASANFMGGGAGSSLLLFAAAATWAGAGFYLLALAALAMVAAGLFCVWLEIGRPWRFVNVLFHPQRSWMTRESWVGLLLFGLGLSAVWFADPSLLAAAAMTGLAFLYCQARLLAAAKGIPAWRNPRTVPLMVASGLCEGGGLFLVAAAILPVSEPVLITAAVSVAVLAMLRAVSWRAYLQSLARDGAPTRTLEVLRAFHPWFLLFGTVAPLGLLAAALPAPGAATLLFAVAGGCAWAAGWLLKFVLIARAAYNQGFALAHVPGRGSGAQGPAVQPGWTMH
jgi:Fe-S-cluster-containing dehydrogenase component